MVLAEDALSQLERRVGEILAGAAVDGDGTLDETAQMLALKRGCRR